MLWIVLAEILYRGSNNVFLGLDHFYSSFVLFLMTLNVRGIKSRVIWEEKPRSYYEHVFGGLSWILIEVGWSSSWWVAPFPRQEVLGCLRNRAKWMSEPASSISPWFLLSFLFALTFLSDGPWHGCVSQWHLSRQQKETSWSLRSFSRPSLADLGSCLVCPQQYRPCLL